MKVECNYNIKSTVPKMQKRKKDCWNCYKTKRRELTLSPSHFHSHAWWRQEYLVKNSHYVYFSNVVWKRQIHLIKSKLTILEKIFEKKSIAQSTRNCLKCSNNLTSKKWFFTTFFGLWKFCFARFLDLEIFAKSWVRRKKLTKSVSFLIINFTHKNEHNS